MPPDHQPQQSKHTAAFVAAIIVGLIIIGGCGYLVWKTQKNKSQPAQTADQIRREFSVPPGFTPTFSPPAPTVGYSSNQPNQPTPQFAPPAQNSFPAPATYPPRGPAVAGAQTGQNNFVIPPASNSQPIYQPYIETYPANNTTLDDVRQILQHSPSVKSVTDTVYNGQPALKYTAYTSNAGGIAYIANNTIYYVHGL